MYCITLRNKFDKKIIGWYDASASNFSTDQRRPKRISARWVIEDRKRQTDEAGDRRAAPEGRRNRGGVRQLWHDPHDHAADTDDIGRRVQARRAVAGEENTETLSEQGPGPQEDE